MFFETNSAARGARWRPTPWAFDVGFFAPESPRAPLQSPPRSPFENPTPLEPAALRSRLVNGAFQA